MSRRVETENERVQPATAMPRRLSPLDLLHPEGVARRSLVFGAGAPPELLAPLQAADGSEPADLVVVAGRDTSSAADALRTRLAPGGVAYLHLGPLARRRLARQAGLELGPSFLNVGRYLVPTTRDAVRWAAESLTASRRARFAARLPALDLAARGALARRADTRLPAAWLDPGDGAVVVGPSIAFLVGKHGLELVAKVGAGRPGKRELAEGEALKRLGPSARAAGANVPEWRGSPDLHGRSVLLETPVPGIVASALLGARPRLLPEFLERLTDWLERWNRATAVHAPLTRKLLEREVLSPARTLDLSEGYAAWLEARCASLEGRTAPLVAAHADLTAANVLLTTDGTLSIVDWDFAREQSLPLADLFYAVADAQHASLGFPSRVRSFRACFTDAGLARKRAEHLELRLRGALGIEATLADLCFHACWLGHAANELAQTGGRAGEFADLLAIAADLRRG